MDPDSYFSDDAMIRRVLRERAVVFAAPRALLMMAAHPVVFEGFFNSTADLPDMYARLQRTADVMEELIWGDRAKADAFTARVRAAHASSRGVLPRDAGRFPAGTPYAADDPELLLWVVACLADAADLMYRRYVAPLTRDERDALWQDYRLVGSCFGLREEDMPADIEAFDAYLAAITEDLWVTEAARELGRRIVMEVPVPFAALPVREAVNQLTIGLLPRRVRRGYGLRWDPARAVALRVNQEYVRRVVLPLLPGRVRRVPGARTGPLGARVNAAAA